jgi:hypothetical protein
MSRSSETACGEDKASRASRACSFAPAIGTRRPSMSASTGPISDTRTCGITSTPPVNARTFPPGEPAREIRGSDRYISATSAARRNLTA